MTKSFELSNNPNEIDPASAHAVGEIAVKDTLEIAPASDSNERTPEEVGAERRVEFMSRLFKADFSLIDPQVANESTAAIWSVMPELLETHKRKLPVPTKKTLSRHIDWLGKWFQGETAHEIAAADNENPEKVEKWAQAIPSRLSKALKWEDIILHPQLAGILTVEVKGLGPIDPLSNPIRVEEITDEDGKKYTLKVLPGYESRPMPTTKAPVNLEPRGPSRNRRVNKIA